MMDNEICYLDNAATTFPKPPRVIDEVGRCLKEYCGNAGRGGHSLSLLAANKIYDCRTSVCHLIGADKPENIIFVPSCTYGLNLVIKGILRQGDHVLISDMEHNAVLRPIHKLKSEGKIQFDTFPALANPSLSDEEILLGIEKKIRRNTRLIICNHQSNICSYTLPIAKIGELCKRRGILFTVDSAQSIGHIPIDIQKMNINFLVAPAHKGLYGLQGAGFVAINSSFLLDTLIEGGNGVHSLLPKMPDFSPERYECGTLPLPCIVGLCEGISAVLERGIDEISSHEKELFRHLRDGLLNITGAKVYLPELEGSTLLFNLNSIPSEQLASLLDAQKICLRGGYHCTSLAHTALSTNKVGGVRTSFGIFNTKDDVDKLLSALNKIKS